MLNILISLLTFILILISLFMVLVILMQRANTNAGMGSAFGGGVAESAFGAETSNVLARATKWSAAAFFVLSLVLFLMYLHRASQEQLSGGEVLPDIPVTQETAPAEPVGQDESAQAVQPTANPPAADEARDAVDAFTGEAVESATADSPPQP